MSQYVQIWFLGQIKFTSSLNLNNENTADLNKISLMRFRQLQSFLEC